MDFTNVDELRSSVLSVQEQLESIIEMLADKIKEEAHQDGDMPWLRECAQKVEVLNEDLRALATIQEHAVDILTNNLSYSSDDTEVSATGLRRMSIEVSQGMLNQHLLTLTDAVQRGMAPIVIGLMLAGCYALGKTATLNPAKGWDFNLITLGIGAAVAVILSTTRINPALTILAGGVAGFFLLG
jgi:hypothetical protein